MCVDVVDIWIRSGYTATAALLNVTSNTLRKGRSVFEEEYYDIQAL